MILKMLILVLILIICPFFSGMIPMFFVSKKRRTTSAVYLSGMILCWALFQLACVPVVILDDFGFPIVVTVYSVILGMTTVAGAVLAFLKWKKEGNIFAFSETDIKGRLTVEEVVEWIMFLAIIIFQLVMFMKMASFDGDDAYYVVNSLLTTDTDTMYRVRPYTGWATSLDIRHSLAVFPIWIAYISRVSGIHATIVSHHIIGLVLIPITYFIYFGIGRAILKRERKKLPIFMIFVAIMQVFGNVSIYTNATFFLTRTWQGKSILANVCIPGILWLLLNIFDGDTYGEDMRFGFWMDLFVLNIVAAMSSTASVFLIAMLIGLSGLVLSIKEKNVQILLRLVITCVPLVAYGVMYLLL